MKKTLRYGMHLLLCAVLMCALFLCGCGKKDPQETAEAFLCAVRDGKTARAEKMMHNPEEYSLNDSALELDKRLASRLKWEFGETEFDLENNYYTIHTDITMVDLSNVMETLLNDAFDDMVSDAAWGVTWEDDTLSEQITAKLEEALSDPGTPTKTQCVELFLVPDDNGGWEVFVTDELTNALTGGVMEWVNFVD